jgi:hypothetical protein
MDFLWETRMPWTRETVFWGPLNSHLPLLEGVGEFINLSPAQLEAFDVSRKYRMAINTSQHTQAQRETDPDGWKEKQRNWSLTRDKDLQAASRNKTMQQIHDTRQQHCDICDHTFGSAFALELHLTR